MIPIPRLPAALTALAALLLLGPVTPLRAADDADTAARRAAAEELLNTMHMQGTVETSSKQMFQSIDQITDRMEKQPGLTPDQTAEAQKLREELHGMITQSLGWDAVKGDLIQAYADDFTVADLKEVVAFYHTPVGQKLVEKQPALTDKLSKNMQQRSRALVPTIRQKIQAATAKTRPIPPAALPSPSGSVVAPPAAPAGVPVPPAPAAMTPPPAPPMVTAPPAPPVTTAPVPVPTPAGTP